MPDFFISRAGPDAPWAEWAAWVLEERGYTTHLQDWDFRPGVSFVHEMQKGVVACEQTIALLSPDYFVSDFTATEWEAAFAKDPGGRTRGLVTVRVRACVPTGLLGRYPYIDLVGKSEEDATEALLAGVRAGRGKPTTRPTFPGSKGAHPAFPGGAETSSTAPRRHSGRSGTISNRHLTRQMRRERGLANFFSSRITRLESWWWF
jgi:hypothetical protein